MLGVPDGTLSHASFGANVPLAAFGGADRARKQPLIPLVAVAKACVEAAAGWYYQMPAKEKKWCGYCIIGALMNFAVFALTLPEAREALSTLKDKRSA